jgi:tetratricopeptide (TPR) repeat protein
VPPGAYLTRVKVTDGQETVADLTRGIEIVAGARPPDFVPVHSTGNSGEASPTAMRPAEILSGDFVRGARASLKASAAPAALRATKGFDLFAEGEYRGAAVELSEALRLDQGNAAIAFVLGWAYEATGDHRQAIGAWRGAALINPKMVPAHLAIADAYLRIAEPALAEQAIRAGLAALPDSAELQAKLAQIQGR